MTWTVKTEQDADGSIVVPLPDDLLVQLGVGIGDILYLTEKHVGTTRCLVLTKSPQISDVTSLERRGMLAGVTFNAEASDALDAGIADAFEGKA